MNVPKWYTLERSVRSQEPKQRPCIYVLGENHRRYPLKLNNHSIRHRQPPLQQQQQPSFLHHPDDHHPANWSYSSALGPCSGFLSAPKSPTPHDSSVKTSSCYGIRPDTCATGLLRCSRSHLSPSRNAFEDLSPWVTSTFGNRRID